MENANYSHLSPSPDWRLLAEFLIPGLTGNEAQVREQIEYSLKQLGLEPGQVRQIQTLMDQNLIDFENDGTSVHIKISVSGIDLKKYAAVNPESAEDPHSSNSGLGFFLVKRSGQQLPGSTGSSYRMLEVLIYRE